MLRSFNKKQITVISILMKTKHELMIIEDEDDIRESLREVSESENYGVITAKNGKKAIEFLIE